MVEQRIKQSVISKMESSHMEAPLSYYQLRKRAATWLRCGTLSSLILTLAGVAMIILGIQGTPASYNIKWIGIAASASGGSLLLLLLLISLIMASFCPQEGGGSIQVQGLPPPCTPSHHHMHSHQHAVPSGSGALTPTSRHPSTMDSMQWMVYYHPSKHQQLEHSILYPIPGFNHGMSSSVGGSNGVHNGGQWAWRAHNTTIQPPPQYSSLYPDPNGNCIGLTTNPNCNSNANNVASTTGGSRREGPAATTPPSTAAATSPSEQRTLQRPQRLTPPLLLRCSPSSDRHVHHHHHTHFRQGTRCPSPSPSSQSCRTPTPGEHRSASTSPGQQSFGQSFAQSFAQQAVRGSPTTPQNPQPREASPQDNHACRQHQLSSPSSQQVHLFHPQHPLNLPLKQSPLTGASQLPSTSRRSFHSSLPSTPLLESVDETRNTSDCV